MLQFARITPFASLVASAVESSLNSNKKNTPAGVAELADATDLKSVEGYPS